MDGKCVWPVSVAIDFYLSKIDNTFFPDIFSHPCIFSSQHWVRLHLDMG